MRAKTLVSLENSIWLIEGNFTEIGREPRGTGSLHCVNQSSSFCWVIQFVLSTITTAFNFV